MKECFPVSTHPERTENLRTVVILMTILPIEKDHPRSNASNFPPTSPTVLFSAARVPNQLQIGAAAPRLVKPFPQPDPTQHTLPARANRSVQSHALNQPMKECDRMTQRGGILRLDCSDLLTVLLFLAAGRRHLATHVPTVRVLRLLLSGFQDLSNAIRYAIERLPTPGVPGTSTRASHRRSS